MLEGNVFALEQLDEDLDEALIELGAGDAAELDDRVVARHRRAVGVACRHHVIGVGDRDDPCQLRDFVAFQPARVALAVDPLVVGEDDVGDRPVAVERRDHARALLRVALDQHPVLVGQRHVGLQDPVGEDELADVVQQRGDVDQLLILAREARFLGDRPRVPRHRRRVPGGHLVAQVERAQQRAQHPHLEAGQLVGAFLQLHRALLGEQQLAEQVLEGDEDDAEEGDRRDPDHVVDEDDRDGKHRAGELGRQHRRQHLQFRGEGRAFDVGAVAGDHHEVDRQGDLEEREDAEVEDGVARADADPLDRLLEEDAADQREGGVGEDVVEQVVALLVGADPAEEDGGDADDRRGRAAEQHHRDDEREEVAGDQEFRLGPDRGEVGEDREGEQDRDQADVPIAFRRPPDPDRHHGEQPKRHCRNREWGRSFLGHHVGRTRSRRERSPISLGTS